MKFLFAIFSIAMMIQVSMAGSLRFQRSVESDEIAKGIEEYMTISKHLLETTQKAVNGALEEIPKTKAYREYIKELQEFADDMEEINSKTSSCLDKTLGVMFEMVRLFVKYSKSGEEGLNVIALIEKHGGDSIDQEFLDFQNKYSKKSMEEKWSHLSSEEKTKLLTPLYTAVC